MDMHVQHSSASCFHSLSLLSAQKIHTMLAQRIHTQYIQNTKCMSNQNDRSFPKSFHNSNSHHSGNWYNENQLTKIIKNITFLISSYSEATPQVQILKNEPSCLLWWIIFYFFCINSSTHILPVISQFKLPDPTQFCCSAAIWGPKWPLQQHDSLQPKMTNF